MSKIPFWCTDEKCSFCNGTGERTNIKINCKGFCGEDLIAYCQFCNGDQYLKKPKKPDKWYYINNREELIEEWLKFTEEPDICGYDYFHFPIEYPCWYRFFISVSDEGGKTVQYFYN
jgi:hypothetical protein